MPGLISVPVVSRFQRERYDFGQAAVTISQAQVALKRNVNDATSGSLLNVGVVAAYDGYIVGITANLLAVMTHTALSLSASVAGSEVASTAGLYRVAMAVATPSIINKFVDYGSSGLKFSKGQLLGLMITTDGNLLPAASADLDAQLYVVYDTIAQPI